MESMTYLYLCTKAANSPNLNAYAERFVLSIRRECLDRFVVLCQNSALLK